MTARAVLIVEDDETLRHVLGYGFEQRGWRVTMVGADREVETSLIGRAYGGAVVDYHVGNGADALIWRIVPQAAAVIVFTGDIYLKSTDVGGLPVHHKPGRLGAMLETLAVHAYDDPVVERAAQIAALRVLALLDGRADRGAPGTRYGSTWIERIAGRMERGESVDCDDARAEAEVVLGR